MDKIPQRDKSQERKSNSTAKAGPKPWELAKYIYPEEPENAKRSSHDDPRLEFALQSHGQHPDSTFTSHDEESDHEALHPACGLGATPDLNASASSASDQGTLAGYRPGYVPPLYITGYRGERRGNDNRWYETEALGKLGNLSDLQYQRTLAKPGLKMFGSDIGDITRRYPK